MYGHQGNTHVLHRQLWKSFALDYVIPRYTSFYFLSFKSNLAHLPFKMLARNVNVFLQPFH